MTNNLTESDNPWRNTKTELPPEGLRVEARNPHHRAISWIEGKNELGKPSWFHKTWEHADDFVTEWRHLENEEV